MLDFPICMCYKYIYSIGINAQKRRLLSAFTFKNIGTSVYPIIHILFVNKVFSLSFFSICRSNLQVRLQSSGLCRFLRNAPLNKHIGMYNGNEYLILNDLSIEICRILAEQKNVLSFFVCHF